MESKHTEGKAKRPIRESLMEWVRRFLNAPTSPASIQPFFMNHTMLVSAGAADPLIETIKERLESAN